jgi:Rhs element Vgr protein
MADFAHTQLVQYESAAWDFILSRAEANGSLVLFDNEKLRVTGPSMEGEAVLKCEYGANVFTFDALMDSESQHSAVEGKAWSSAEQTLITSEGKNEFKNEIGNITSKELAEILNQEPFELKCTDNLPMEELQLWTKAKATRNELSKIVGNVCVRGNASVYPGKAIELSGFGDRFSGKAFVTGVRHEVTQGGWKSHIQFGLPSAFFGQQPNFNAIPAAGALPAINGLQIGVVTQIEQDPENEYRIRVRIPTISNEEDGIWAHQANGYAGDDYGIRFCPEIGDEVVVGFVNEDPRKAIVLGVLHSSGKAAPLPLNDDNFKKGIISRTGLKIIWDDEKKTISIATPGGHQFILDDSNKKISIEDSSSNKFEMTEQGVAVQSMKNLKLSAVQNIELEGVNIQCKATGKFTAEGNGGAEVRTSSIAVLKGSLVQIN